MFFATPIWLFGLVPWLGVALWLMWGRRRKTPVPFLWLWREAEPGPPPKRSFQLPPPAVIWALGAILLAILAAAGPTIAGSGARGEIPTVILDRGATMSGLAGDEARYVAAARRAQNSIQQTLGAGPIEFLAIPDGESSRISSSQLEQQAKKWPPTAVDSGEPTRAATLRALGSEGPVVVISDRKLDLDDSRLAQVTPGSNLSSVGICDFSVRAEPKAEAMVGVLNQSDKKTARLTISSGDQQVQMDLDLPERGQRRDYFVQMPVFGPTARAKIETEDELPAWREAWLARQTSWPVVEARAAMPPEMARIIQVYQANRPAGAEGRQVAIVAVGQDLPAGPAAAVLVDEVGTKAISGNVSVADSPVSGGIDWNAVAAGAVVAEKPSGQWTPVVWAGDQVLVAIRQEPARQAWVGFYSEHWATRADFAFFWGRLFDWLGGADREGWTFAKKGVAKLEGHWQRIEGSGDSPELGMTPGLYQNAEDGSIVAVDAMAQKLNLAEDSDGREKLAAYAASRRNRGTSLAAAGIVAALACLAVAAVLWPKRQRAEGSRQKAEGRRQ